LFVNLKGRDHLEDLDIDAKIMDLKETELEVMTWIHLAQDRD